MPQFHGQLRCFTPKVAAAVKRRCHPSFGASAASQLRLRLGRVSNREGGSLIGPRYSNLRAPFMDRTVRSTRHHADSQTLFPFARDLVITTGIRVYRWMIQYCETRI